MDQASSGFVDWLREQLNDRDWPDRELAEKMGVSPAAVSRWMGGTRTPSPGNVTRLAHALSVDDGEIFTRLAEDNAPGGLAARPPAPYSDSRATIDSVDPDQFRDWLKQELGRQDIHAEDLARQIGVEATVVRFWLLGLLTPAPNQLGNLALALNRGRRLRPAG